MEVYLNLAETGIGTYGVNAGSQRYFGHDASAMSRTEAARIAAILPLPKKRGAVAPKGFTRRYGGTIAARIGAVARDGLDACVYSAARRPDKPPPSKGKPKPLPGEEYESAKPLPPVEEAVDGARRDEPGHRVPAEQRLPADEPRPSPLPSRRPRPKSRRTAAIEVSIFPRLERE